MEAEFVRYATDDGIAVITLDRPQAANAQNPQVLKELDAAWSAPGVTTFGSGQTMPCSM